MRRLIDYHLEQWKDYRYRKPLLLRGSRQVGKTYAVRQLGRTFDNVVEINFEQFVDAKKAFEKDLVPQKILQTLIAITGQNIVPGKTLLFFDEIQECPEAIKSLRYFYEEMPSLHLVGAGSLLDFTLEKIGIAVGRISFLYLFPLSFIEFLLAGKESMLAKTILNHPGGAPINEAIHSKLLDLIGEYLAIGGMPEAVFKWMETKHLIDSCLTHQSLIDTYRQDFEKYAKKHQIKYLNVLFDQIPHLIGKPFKYNSIHGDYKKRELSPCLDLLCHANVIHKIHHSAGNGLPLGAEVNLEWFKLIFLDIALCQTLLGADLSQWFLDPKKTFINQGPIMEAFIGQEILCYSNPQRKTPFFIGKENKEQVKLKWIISTNIKDKSSPLKSKAERDPH